MRTRRENAARKGLRLLNENKRVRTCRLGAERPRRGQPPPVPGARFGMLTAVEPGEDYVRPGKGREARWYFRCECGATVLWKPSTVRSNLADLGWCSCPDCYRAAGGWEAIARKVGAC